MASGGLQRTYAIPCASSGEAHHTKHGLVVRPVIVWLQARLVPTPCPTRNPGTLPWSGQEQPSASTVLMVAGRLCVVTR